MGENPLLFILFFLLNLEDKLKVMSVLFNKKSFSSLGVIMLAIAVIAVLLLNILTLIALF